MATATCHTEGCDNAGIALPNVATVVDIDGEPYPVSVVICGVCGQEITDVADDERNALQEDA